MARQGAAQDDVGSPAADATQVDSTVPDSGQRDADTRDNAVDGGADTSFVDASESGSALDARSSWFDTCIDGWPTARMSTPRPSSTNARRQLWTLPLDGNFPIHGPLVATDSVVAVSEWSHMRIVGIDGVEKGSIETLHELASPPVADAQGNIYWSDASTVFSADATGRIRWQAALGAYAGGGEFLTPGPLLLDPNGVVSVVGLTDQIVRFNAASGSQMGALPLPTSMNLLTMGVGSDVLYIDPNGILTLVSSGKVHEISDSSGWSPGWTAIAGGKIGLVVSGYVDVSAGSTRTVVLDACGTLKWSVDGSSSLPLAIAYGDDLIVRDGEGPFDLRRLSSSGELVGGPVSTDRPALVVVGADDTLYAITCTPSASQIVAFSSTLAIEWTVDLGNGSCPASAVLGPSGVLYVARQGLPGALIALQTASPGPGDVSWNGFGGNSRATLWLSAGP